MSPEAAPTDQITVHSGDLVLRQRLVPIGYITPDAEALDARSDKPLVPVGVALMRLMSNAGIIACVIAARPTKGGADAFWVGFTGGDRRICLSDMDKDGRFEGFVQYKGHVAGLPSINGRLPKTLHPLKAPVAYTTHDPRTLPMPFFLGIRYDGKSTLSGAPVFIDAFGQDGDVGTLNRGWPRADGGKGKLQPTGTVLLKGAVLDVIADSDDTLTIKVVKPFPIGIVGISQIGQTGFY